MTVADAIKKPKLGAFLMTNSFPEGELTRIAGLAGKGERPAIIIRKYLTQQRGYQQFKKHVTIPGRRHGSEQYNKAAVDLVIKELGNPRHREYKNMWQLYRSCVAAFIEQELPTLDLLLREVPTPDNITSAEIIKTLCVSAKRFGVAPEDVATFYEVWGMDRLSDFDQNVSEWFKVEDAAHDKHRLEKLNGDLGALAVQVASLAAENQRLRESLAGAQKVLESIEAKDLATAKKLETIEQRVKELGDETKGVQERTTDAAGKLIEKRVAGLAEKVRALEETAKVPRSEVSTRDLQKLKSDTDNSVHDLKETLKKQQDEVSALENKLEAARAPSGSYSIAPLQPAVKYRSPLVGPVARERSHPNINQELEFILAWLQHLNRRYEVALTPDQATAYHRALLASHVIICNQPIALSWIECLGLSSGTIHIAAAPTWFEDTDWSVVADYVFRESDGAHFGVIHNYDVGLVDCYLIPSLVLWSLRGETRGLSKIFLVPSQPSHTPSSSLLEHALWLSDSVSELRLRAEVRLFDPRRNAKGVDPALIMKWRSTSKQTSLDLKPLLVAVKCDVPEALLANVTRTASCLAQYIERQGAIAFAVERQLIPWIQFRYDERRANELSGLLRTYEGL